MIHSVKAFVVMAMILSVTAIGSAVGYLDSPFFAKFGWLVWGLTCVSWLIVFAGMIYGYKNHRRSKRNVRREYPY